MNPWLPGYEGQEPPTLGQSGFTHSQPIDDVLDPYGQHVEFVRLNAGAAR